MTGFGIVFIRFGVVVFLPRMHKGGETGTGSSKQDPNDKKNMILFKEYGCVLGLGTTPTPPLPKRVTTCLKNIADSKTMWKEFLIQI